MLTPGTILQQNRYRIEAVLGQGGMGAVYRAWHLGLEKYVAIKEMVPQPGLEIQMLDQLRVQFRREAVILARLDHSNLVRVLDSFEEEGRAYLVMDLVEGENLSDRIQRMGQVSEAEVVRWARELLAALAYCHAQGVFHRDIKPHNIIICADGRAVLVDFGLVKLWDPNDPRTKTVMRGIGTPEYAPPEQYDAQTGHTDGRSDLYSLGATLYHALSGESPPTVTQRVVNPEVLRPLQQLAPNLNPQLANIVMRALELRPADRFQSAEEMLVDFREGALFSSPPVTKSPETVAAPSHGLDSKTQVMPSVTEQMPPPSESDKPPQMEQRKPFWKRLKKAHIVAIVVSMLIILCLCVGARLRNRDARQSQLATEPTSEPLQAVIEAELSSELTQVAQEVEPPIEPEVPPLRIGLVTDFGPVDDGGFNQAAWNGVMEVGRTLEAEVDFIESEDQGAYIHNISQFAEAGYNIIVTVGFMMAEATVEMARAYPDIKFIGVDQAQAEPIPNLVGLVFHENQIGFLAGMLAAHLTENNVVAVVLGSEQIPQIVGFRDGYVDGVTATDPSITVLANFHPGEMGEAFSDPEWGAATAAQFIREGADVIFVAAGMTGNGALMEAAGHEGVLCIGVDTDQWETIPEARPCLVTSAIKQIDGGIVELVHLAIEDRFPAGNYYGGAGLAPFHDFDARISPELKTLLHELEAQLRE
ncbi:MAG: BMP family ABC transporter substrate-binding protein [Anaerolineae bacterium]|nr:BMP family ABC transporter substrate-binding protein [Anaerolineae bacterium]